MTAAQPTPAGSEADLPVAVHRRALLLGLVGMVLALLVAVLMYRSGTSDHPFGPVLPNNTPTYVTQYSGPWIVGSAGALLLAGLLALSTAADVRRLLAARRRAAANHAVPRADTSAPAGDPVSDPVDAANDAR